MLLPSPVFVSFVPDPEVFYPVGLGLADLALAVLVAFSVGPIARRVAARRMDAMGWLALAFVALVAAAFVWNPSPQGAGVLFRLVAAAAIAIAVVELREPRERRLLLFAIAVTAAIQTTLAAAQIVVGDVLVAYEHPPVLRAGPFIRPAGTMQNSIVLAGYALLFSAMLAAPALAGPRRWSALVAIAVAPVGFTFSRAALAGAALAALPLVAGALRRHRPAVGVLVALVAGVGLPALLTLAGWTGRGDVYPVEASAGRRAELIVQTLPLLAAEPVFGIGPGNTVTLLRERQASEPGSVEVAQPPHDVPYLVMLEAGVPAGLLAAALLAALGLRALRTGPVALLPFLALLPHLLLDQYPWSAELGLPLVGLWAGASASPPDDAA